MALRWNSTGITVAGITGSVGKNASQLNQPTDIAISSSGALYIVEFGNHRVNKWSVGASSGQTVAGQADASFNSTSPFLHFPAGLYLDSDDNVYVTDTTNSRVQFWAKGASQGTTVAGTGRSE